MTEATSWKRTPPHPRPDQPERETVTADTTRAELADMLAMANRDTKREPRVIGTPEYPTRWDEAHEFLNDLLDDWERAPSEA